MMRKVGQGHFAHNKFVKVACDSAGKGRNVFLSGSTNWTMTGAVHSRPITASS